MERKFCGLCGKPLGTCSCDTSVMQQYGTTAFHAHKSGAAATNQNTNFIIEQFDNVALSQGEVVVRQYHIGKFTGLRRLFGKGNSYMLITNKRVISKSDTKYLGTMSSSVEEVNIDNICGVSTMYAKGVSIWKMILGIILIISALVLLSQAMDLRSERYWYEYRNEIQQKSLEGFGCLAVGLILEFLCRKPSYMFHLVTKSASEALITAANIRGKVLNKQGYGLVFQFVPTKEAIPMMREIGACITDIRDKGDYAVEAWRKV